MTESHAPRHTPPAGRRPRPSLITLVAICALAVTIVILAGRQQTSHAEASKVDIVYLSVTSEGPAAKAWYDGAPSTGVRVQEALTKFAREGYTVASVTEDLRSTIEDTAFVILLQRVR